MRIFFIPVSRIYRRLRMETSRLLGEEEVKSLENDIIVPVAAFLDEVYDDTVGDVMREQKRNEDEVFEKSAVHHEIDS